MSHTLHRQECAGEVPGDFVVLMMAAKGYNEGGAAARLKEFLRLACESGAVNLGDMLQGALLGGRSLEDLMEGVSDHSIVHAVFTSASATEQFLATLRSANLGLSVVATGPFREIEAMCERLGLPAAPHTVAFSLGIMGRKERLPRREVLEITTMCGHALVSPRLVEKAVEQVRSGALRAEEAALMISRPCVCGVFNPARAASLLARLAGMGETEFRPYGALSSSDFELNSGTLSEETPGA